MTARFGDNAHPDTGIEADLRQTAHADFARQPCNKPGMACLAAQRGLPLF